MALSDLISDFKSVFRHKNIDSTFAALSNVLDEIDSGAGGGASEAVLNVELAAGTSGNIEVPNPLPEYINITTTGVSSDGDVGVWLPLGTSHGQTMRIKWEADETDEGTDLAIEVMGYSLTDSSNTYTLPKTRVSLGGFFDLRWDAQYGRWVIVSQYMTEAPEVITGKTSFYFYFKPGDDGTTRYMQTGNYDIIAQVSVDATENTDGFTIEINDGYFAGQRTTLYGSVGTNVVTLAGGLTDSEVNTGSIDLSGDIVLVLQWKMSTGRWVVIDKLTDIV